jgi:hypothetical protein
MAVFKKIRSVTRNLIKMENNREYYFKIQAPMHLGKQIDDKKEPATLLNVIDLETGEEGQIIVGSVLRDVFIENYPGDSYVDRCFEVVKFRDAAQKYNTYNLSEVADPREEFELAQTIAKSGDDAEPTKSKSKK